MTVQPQDLILILTVFLQGALSFFSPCVLPVVPLYLGYLAAGAKEKSGRRRRILINTLFFVLGISFAFFLLGLAFLPWGVSSRAIARSLLVWGASSSFCSVCISWGSSDPPRPSRRSGACRCGLTVWRWARCRRCCWDSSSALHGHPVSDLR